MTKRPKNNLKRDLTKALSLDEFQKLSIEEQKEYRRKQKEDADQMAQELVDNLNRNVMRDHIEYVERGIRKPDADYYRALEMRKRGEL